MIIKSIADVVHGAVAERLSDLQRLHREQVVPIFVRQRQLEGNPVPTGTGFFFRCADEWFLVTAAHVLMELLPDQKPGRGVQLVAEACVPRVPCIDEMSPLIPLRGVALHGNYDTKIDVAVLRLPRDVSGQLGAWRPVSLADVDSSAPQDGWYFLSGYPRALVTSDGVRFESTPHALVLRTDRSCDDEEPNTRLALTLDRWDTRGPDGVSHGVPDLWGISGAPVWRIFDDGASRFAPRLVGIQTGFVEAGKRFWSIRASRWNLVRAILRRAVPGLVDHAERIITAP